MKTSAAFSLFALLAGAAQADPDPFLGSSVRANERAQIIDQDPLYRGDPAPGSSGVKSVRALERYRLDREKPLILPTSDTKSGAQGTVVNGTGETQNGTQILAGDNASGQGSTGQNSLTGAAAGGASTSAGVTAGPASR